MDWNALLYAAIGGLLGSGITQLGEGWRQSREPKKERYRRQRNAVADFLSSVYLIQSEQISVAESYKSDAPFEPTQGDSYWGYIKGISYMHRMRSEWSQMMIEITQEDTREKAIAVGNVINKIQLNIKNEKKSDTEYVLNLASALNNELETSITELRDTASNHLG